MRRRRCFAVPLAAALAFIITTARGMPTAMTVEAFPGEASTEAVSSSDNAFTTEAGQIPKDGSHHGGFHYGVTEGTEADQDSKRTDEPSEATGTWPSSPQLHRPVPTAIDYEQSGGTRYAYTVDYGNGEDLTTDLAASEGNMTKTQGTEQPQEKVFWKFFNDDLDTIQPAAKDQASTSGTQLQEQRDMFSKSARYINSFGLVSEPLIEARADDTDDDVPSRLSAATMSSSGSSDPLSSSEAEPEVHKNADGSRGHTDLSSSPSVTVPSVTQTWTAATYRDVVSEDAISPRTYSTKAPAEEMPELSGTGGEGKIVQMSGMAPIAEVTSEKSHERLSIGKEDLASGNMKVDTVNGDSQQTPDDSDGEHKDEPTRSASTDKRKDPSVIVSAREEQGDAVSSGRANPFPQAGQPGSASPTIKASGGDGAQGVPSGTAQGDHLMARAGDKPDSDKVSQPGLPRTEQPKASGGVSGRGAEAPKSAEVPRSVDAPAAGNSKVTQPESPRAEQPKASEAESGRGAEAPKPAEVPRSADAPATGSSKGSQPESPRAEQPKASGGESGRGAEAPKLAEVPRTSDVPIAGNSKVTQPESPRAEQPKAGGGESGRGAEPPKSAEVPRSPDAPAAGNSKVTQPESPRAEQPKAGGGESGRGAEPPKSAEVPRSPDSPAAGNSKVTQPESPRAEQPKAGGGVSGRGAEPPNKSAEPPRSSDVPMVGNNKASQPESPRSEQNKAQVPGKASGSPESPRSEQQNPPAIVMPVTNKNSEGRADSEPETPRTVVPKIPAPSSSGQDGRGEAKGGKAPETVVIVEDKKEGKEEAKKPGPTKTVETTESETHISIDENPERKPTAAVVQEGKPHDGKDKGEETVLVVKNVTVEVVPEADVPDSKPDKIVPAVYWRSASDEEDPAADDMENIGKCSPSPRFLMRIT
ncbi:neurofilament heavy polypeptide-like [Rhipicephalus sanguineus]|uniref:neurofilament heavy polypeptide-like n=1 Tax=Rhipicephalus sanguineus TaxID=34632 RepID=UPI0020C33C57|nr:neurofilament heavy polypeptide-like [Rhipicephalus sanguineus]